MVLSGVLTLDEAYRAVDFNTILLLLGMMILIGYLKIANCFRYLSYLLITHARNSFLLLCFVSFSSGILSALFVNDTICLMFTPLLILALNQTKLNPVPYLIALATSSNIGSVVTLTGNPQNMLIGVFSKISYLDFTLHLIPIGIVSLMANVLIIYGVFRKDINFKKLEPIVLVKPELDGKLTTKSLVVLFCIFLGFVFTGNLPLSAITGGLALIIISGTKPQYVLEKVDWTLLLFFSGLFIVVGGINKAGFLTLAHNAVEPYLGKTESSQVVHFSIFSVIASNLVSNVPFVLLSAAWIEKFIDPKTMWYVLAMSSTFAGNLTVMGSVANMIVLELSKEYVHVGFWDFFKVGFTTTVVSTIIGIILLIH
ncbi:Na+/H+ antiporter NhaD and related arsenite permeases [Candidatus Brocadia sinica JPN1]|uniref:Na+/H+ antiporter NhaD and related arsenite permeases n=2 Tax=Candidatus Brocadiaceae TaxID=1127830 RepID=A0ABQ0JV37_9BACT|nr:Na+/H+ antiporter NhaD and related arsenite permeases [Candidatus Brocadia sinica JPN1]GIK13877.1 MAG: anion transporter [Candidatus Brocadia sinica]GJQ16906.1 MAG: anion transporter [Candidatus Brocadia sinica]